MIQLLGLTLVLVIPAVLEIFYQEFVRKATVLVIPQEFMEINIGISECDKNVDNYYGRNIGSHTAPAERLSTVSSLFMVIINKISMLYIFLGNWVYQNKLQQQNPKFTMPSIGSLQYLLRSRLRERRQ